jgi:hypothetical protein
MSHAPQIKSVFAIHPGEILLKEFLEPMGLTRWQRISMSRYRGSMKSFMASDPSARIPPCVSVRISVFPRSSG